MNIYYVRQFMSLILSLIALTSSAQNALIIAEYLKDESGTGNYTYLVSYNFQNGEVISKDTILGASVTRPKEFGSYVRFDLGRNFIYKNRYVISGTGNVIDLQTKSLVIEESDDFIEAIGDTLIFHRNNVITGTGYLLLNLKTKHYNFIKDKYFWSVKGLQSPNHKYGLTIDKSEYPYKIVLNDLNNKGKIIVKDVSIGTPISGQLSKVPIFWMDDSNFVYAKYVVNDTFESCVSIRKVNIHTKSDDLMATIDKVPFGLSAAFFEKDRDGELIFYCEKGVFKINKQGNSLSGATQQITHSEKFTQLNNQFQMEISKDYRLPTLVKYHNDSIGKVRCNYNIAVTNDGFMAVEHSPENTELGYPSGIKIWNSITREWKIIEIPWICAIIGWRKTVN